jgi:predicted nuclease with RNAse H fold
MDTFGTELTPKQHQAIQALIAQSSIPSAATSAGVSVRSLYRWLDEPAFRLALNTALDMSIDAAARGMVRLTEKAIQVVETALDDTELHPATRLRAADLVLSNMLKLAELRTLAQRVAALEDKSI